MLDDDEEYFLFLDELRETGLVNMYGACSYLRQEFGIDKKESHRIMIEWMRTREE